MSERANPYIGVSGVVRPEQQHELQALFTEHGLEHTHQLALGVKATHKTQFLDIDNKYGSEWFPVGDRFEAAVTPEPIFPELHVAQVFMDPECISDAAYRKAFLEKVARRGKAWLQAIQFDLLPWHTDGRMFEYLEEVKQDTGFNILLQAHGDSMEHYAPKELARVLGRSASALEYVLLDSSHGKGIRLDTNKLLPYVEALYESPALEHVGIGIAGGLNGDVVRNELSSIVAHFPSLSWDAEGQLHPLNEDGKRPVSMTATKEYFAASSEVLNAV